MATVELGIISVRSYLPIAWAETMPPMAEDNARSDRPLRFLASLRRSLNIGIPPSLRFTFYDIMAPCVNHARMAVRIHLPGILDSQGRLTQVARL